MNGKDYELIAETVIDKWWSTLPTFPVTLVEMITETLKDETADLHRQIEELRQALKDLLGLVRDTIATANDLHEVHAADAALNEEEKD